MRVHIKTKSNLDADGMSSTPDLKQKLARGEKLEVTQMQKIDAEQEIRKELESLGG